VIVVATDDFELYHDLIKELRGREVTFTTIEPGAPIPPGATAIVTGGEPIEAAEDIPMFTAAIDEVRATIDDVLACLRGGGGRLIVGVDPGIRPGIVVLEGDVIVSAFQVPLDDAVSRIEAEVDDAPDAIVRIGDGARLQSAKLINDLDVPRIELVDETGTTPYLGTGARGFDDILAAANIARIEGEPVNDRSIEPTDGELARIKSRSREVSPVNRAIDERLARMVAQGELSIDEALDRHRSR